MGAVVQVAVEREEEAVVAAGLAEVETAVVPWVGAAGAVGVGVEPW